MNQCKKCGVEEKAGVLEEKGAVCTVCCEWYHIKCISADRRPLRKGPMVCDNCSPKQAPPPPGSEKPFVPDSNSTMLPPPPHTATTSGRVVDEVDPRDVELRMLRDKLKQVEEMMMKLQAAQADATGQSNVGSGPSEVVSQSGGATTSATGVMMTPIATPSGGMMPHTNRAGGMTPAESVAGMKTPAMMNATGLWTGSVANQWTGQVDTSRGAIPKDPISGINSFAGMTAQLSSGSVPLQQQQHFVNNANESANSSSWAFDRTQWRSRLPQELVLRTQAPPVLTKDQLARRKAMNTVLPVFKGNPLKWLHFIEAYLQTAGDVCGFRPSEDLERIRVALRRPALTTVENMLYHAENLDSVLGLLQMTYGETAMILEAMTRKVDALPPLDANLKNIALFAGRVDQLRNVNNMIDGRPGQIEMVLKLERKLPLVHAEKWLQYKAQLAYGPNTSMYQIAMSPALTGTLEHMADFLFTLYKTMANLHLHIQPVVDSDDEGEYKHPQNRHPVKKTVLMVNNTVSKSSTETDSGAPRKKMSYWQKKREQKKNSHPEAPAPVTTNRNECPFKCGSPPHKWHLCPEFKNMSVEARWNWTKKLRRCFLCFGDHQQSSCESKLACNLCAKRHNPLLHPTGMVVHEVINFASDKYESTLFRIASVTIEANGQQRPVNILMDSGSSVTLIDSNLAAQLGVKGTKEKLSLSWKDGEIQPAVETERIQVRITNPRSGEEFLIKARTIDDLNIPGNRVTMDLLKREQLSHLPVSCCNKEVPLIMMGQDNAILMRSISSVVGASNRVVASETPLGFVVEGEWVDKEAVVLVTNVHSDSRMERMLTKYIEEEHFGLQPDGEVAAESDEVLRARRIMNTTTVQHQDGRYETGLLWANDKVELPNNRCAAVDRTQSFLKKLDKNPVLRDKVMNLMQSHVDNGYVCRVTKEPAVDGCVWYLPIFNVHNPAKPEKVRLVFDAAAVYNGFCLNSVLLSGPDLTVPLVNVLLRFRTHPVAISGDIQDMYHRVYVREADRSVQRFVWPLEGKLVDYEMRVLTFGATCSPALAQYVKCINAEKYKNDWPAAASAIINDHYVDDWLGGGRTEEEVVALAQKVIEIHAAAGFVMHKLISNSDLVLKKLGVVAQQKEIQISQSAILGMNWNTVDDTLALRFRAEKYRPALLDGSSAPTKREMLSVVMTIYDPLGLVCFITIELKNILREAWREQAPWDMKLYGAIQRRWRDWLHHLIDLQTIVVPRWHGTAEASVTLHIYVDASETAIAAVCYVVQQDQGCVRRSLVMAKCLVAPLKTKSIPRLELDAAVLGVRLMKMVTTANPWTVERVVFWSDAKDVLWWLRSSTRRYTPYVANRVSAILTETSVDQWRWTPTHLNPADWGTKWIGKRDDESLWWRGPDYLSDSEIHWPHCVEEEGELLEVRPLLMVKLEKHRSTKMLLPDVDRFSRWIVYRNATAMAVKFIDILRRKVFPGPLSNEDLRRGEAEIFKCVQMGLADNKEYQTFLSALAPFVDELGVLRMRGRAARSEIIAADARFPVIVVGDHPAIILLIQYYHQQQGHQNTTAVVNELRQKVIMPRMKVVVRRVISWCRWCAVKRTKPIVPQLSALPLARMGLFMPSFTYVGIDYFGPQDVLVGRRHEKRWGVVMTCLTTRALYLEVAYSLSTQSCIAVLDSLVSRRGLPLEIHSDNATCFVGAAKEFVGPMGHRPTWRFIPPRCPAMGGAWERIVGITKRALEGLTLPRTPSDERWRHALVKIERLINSRPLTDIPLDPEEEESLTPNHFLMGSSNGIKPKALLSEWDPNAAFKKWDEIVDAFYRRFIKEYLPTVSARTTCQRKTTNVAVGDIVFICDDDYRAGWLRAEIVRVLEDPESAQVRQVYVRTADGKEYRRATSKIAPIISSSERN